MRDIHLNDRYYFYDRGQIRPGANTKQKQLPDKVSLDTKVEGWAVCFCFGNVTNNPFKLKNVEIKCRTMTKTKKRTKIKDNEKTKVYVLADALFLKYK